MHSDITNIQHLLYKIIVSAILAVIITCNCAAQTTEPLPDSVKTVEDDPIITSNSTVVSPGSATVESGLPKINKVVPDTAMLRSVPDSVINRFKKDRDFAYTNDSAYWAKEPVSNNKNFFDYFWGFITSKPVRIFVYILIIGVLLFAFYKIVAANRLYLFYSSPKKIKTEKNVEEDVYSENVDEKIRQAMQAMDYRLAIRWMHLKALRLLNDRELIRFHANGTNEEYISQFSNHGQSTKFEYLTRAYDYAWYGGFALTQQQAGALHQDFTQFYTSIES